ncbi:hypothetical protein SAY87_021209 [Trapa incisa]|uniref:Uncharacterized protein n=1 Tax=Trapa incisa TaxID=236973 RepID=A0AAN7JRT6_9MYRT|nr:hypothetical protein SAY87_021209 [Trapa incisa]
MVVTMAVQVEGIVAQEATMVEATEDRAGGLAMTKAMAVATMEEVTTKAMEEGMTKAMEAVALVGTVMVVEGSTRGPEDIDRLLLACAENKTDIYIYK